MKSGKLRSLLVVVAVVLVVGIVAWRRERASASSSERPDLPRLVDVGAGTCKSCLEMIPILEAVKSEFDGRAIVEVVDLREDADAKDEYGVRLIPTQIFFDSEGREVWRHEGFLAKEEIVERLEGLAR